MTRRGAALGVVAVLAVALFLRLWGIDVGRGLGTPIGFSYHLDEPDTLARAAVMAASGDPDPRWFKYPSLLIYLNAALLLASPLLGRPDPYVLGRLLTAMFGVATVGVVFLLGRRLASTRAGLAGAALLAVSLMHVRESHFVTTDVPMAFFSTLCALLVLRFEDGARRRHLALAFVAAGLAAGTKYNGAPAVVMPALAILLHSGDRWWRRGLHLAAGGALFLATFVLTTPFLVTEPVTFAYWFRYIHDYQIRGQFGFERPGFASNLAYLSGYLFRKGVGPPAAILAVAGAASALSGRRRARALPAAAFAVTYLLWLATYRTSFTRNMMPIVPLLATFGGVALDRILSWWVDGRTAPAARTALAAGAVALVVAWPLQEAVRYDLAVSRSTRTVSIPWIVENLPPGSRIVTEIYGPPLKYTHPGRWRLDERWNLGKNVPDPAWFERSGTDFIISNSGAWEMVLSSPGMYPEEERIYRAIEERYPVLQVFEGDTVDPLYSSISPTIRIYDCRRRAAR